MEFNGVITEIVTKLKKEKVKPHTKLIINGKDRVWYGSKALGVQAYRNVLEKNKNTPVEAVIVGSSKKYDKNHGLFFDLNVEDVLRLRLEQKDLCLYCKTPMQVKKRKKADGLTIERLDTTLGHTRDNCVLTCWDCNCICNISRTIKRMKSNPDLMKYVLAEVGQ